MVSLKCDCSFLKDANHFGKWLTMTAYLYHRGMVCKKNVVYYFCRILCCSQRKIRVLRIDNVDGAVKEIWQKNVIANSLHGCEVFVFWNIFLYVNMYKVLCKTPVHKIPNEHFFVVKVRLSALLKPQMKNIGKVGRIWKLERYLRQLGNIVLHIETSFLTSWNSLVRV